MLYCKKRKPMKNLILIFIFNVFLNSAMAQIQAMPISELEEFFTLTPKTDFSCDSWGTTCFFDTKPVFANKKDRPEWMGMDNRYYAIKISGTSKISRAYSDASSICRNKNIELRDPVVEFKNEKEGREYVLIIYSKGRFPKKK